MLFRFKHRFFEFQMEHCVLFGILNVTPDSFSDGGKFDSTELAVQQALRLEKEGAHVIDVGGESTRPGAASISSEEELKRIVPVIQALKAHLRIPISIDTTKSVVAEAALAEGAEMVNDISGLKADPRMSSVIASSQAGVILMHSRGTPSTMQTLCEYPNILEGVKQELRESVRRALEHGIPSDHIAIDPGIGFAKTADQNFTLLKNLKSFCSENYPVMVGVSRKSFLGGTVETRGPGTLAAELWAYQQGIHMIRTHDVAATRQAMKAFDQISKSMS
jgi:dihydropteroate synthase